jgi:2-oxoglutarate dehydrogenase E1 component
MVNNQIGYTTTPVDQRPGNYSTELCKTYDIPVIHVNADDIESVYKIAEFAI